MIKINKLSDEDFKIAKQISDFIEGLDKILFPDKSIEVFVLQFSPPDEAERFRYCSEAPNFISNYRGELYLIFSGGLAERIKEEQQKKIILFSEQEIEKETNDLLFLFQEEVLISIAVHEVRHRIQYHYPERIFSPQYRQNTNNEYLKRLFTYVSLLCEQISPNSFIKEFDASLVEHFIVEKCHWGKRNISEMAIIVASGSKHGYFKSFFK